MSMRIPPEHELLFADQGIRHRIISSFKQLRDAKATWQILRLIVIIQAVPVLWDSYFSAGHAAPDKLSQTQILLGLSRGDILSGRFWQIFSYAWIHANGSHLIMNGLAILLLGAKIEFIAGKKTLLTVAAISACVGGLFFLIFTYPSPYSPRLVGASAVCFGFLTLLTTLSPESRFLPFMLRGRSLGLGILLANFLLTILHPDLPTGNLAKIGSHLSSVYFPDLYKIGHSCHLGGALVGWMCGHYILRPRISLERLQKLRERNEKSGNIN